MVDTRDLKSFGSNAVRVRVSSWGNFRIAVRQIAPDPSRMQNENLG